MVFSQPRHRAPSVSEGFPAAPNLAVRTLAAAYRSIAKARRRASASAARSAGPSSPRRRTNFILCQHRQLVNANRRGCIQTSLALLVNRDIEVGNAGTRGNGSGNEIVVDRRSVV